MADAFKDLGVINPFEFSIEEDGEEFLVRQFELQGSNGAETRLLVVSATDVPEHWAENCSRCSMPRQARAILPVPEIACTSFTEIKRESGLSLRAGIGESPSASRTETRMMLI